MAESDNVHTPAGVVPREGFFAKAPTSKPTVTGAKGTNAALGSLLTALVGLGLIIDNSSA